MLGAFVTSISSFQPDYSTSTKAVTDVNGGPLIAGDTLRYTITVEGQAHEVALVYCVEGDVLRTDNPAAPHATATRFWQGEGDVLVFDFAGPIALFVREGG